MQAFTQHKGLVIPLDKANVDTDQIIPKQYLKSIKRTGFGVSLFDDWRYLDPGEPGMDHSTRRVNPDFVLNQARYKGGSILVTRKNFGCGSSREHAPWAILDFGVSAIISPSYADIFYNNCFKNGVLPIILSEEEVSRIFTLIEANEGLTLAIDLPNQKITNKDLSVDIDFDIDPMRKQRLLEGLDDIGLTLKYADKIKDYEAKRKLDAPWLF